MREGRTGGPSPQIKANLFHLFQVAMDAALDQSGQREIWFGVIELQTFASRALGGTQSCVSISELAFIILTRLKHEISSVGRALHWRGQRC